MYVLNRVSLTTSLFLLSIVFTLRVQKSTSKSKKFDLELSRVEVEKNIPRGYELKLGENSQILFQTSWSKDISIEKTLPESYYVVNLYVGNPSVKIPAILDTGSGYTWVASKHCKSENNCLNVKEYYDHEKSTTSKDMKITLRVEYGSGDFVGNFYEDEIKLSPEIILKNEPVGEIQSITKNAFNNGEIAGIVGLAFNTTSTDTGTNFFDGLVRSKALDRNVISFDMTKDGGQVNFGYINANKYRGELIEYPVIDKYYWTIKMNKLIFGSSITYCDPFCYAIIDSGSADTLLSTSLYNEINTKYKLEGDCMEIRNLPQFNLEFEGKTFLLNSKDYTTDFFDTQTFRKKCRSKIGKLEVNIMDHKHYVVLGEDFFRKYYVVFDKDNESVHLAEKA